MKLLLPLLFSLGIVACRAPEAQKDDTVALLTAIDCERWAGNGIMPLAQVEDEDRAHYQPLAVEVIPIRMKTAGDDGYHEPFRGNYILTIERYADEATARKRAAEYAGGEWWNRIAKAPAESERGHSTTVGKSSVRCWAASRGNTAYLLTTHAAMHSGLEAKTKGIRQKLEGYLQDAK